MKIALSGPHGAGKSTLINALKTEPMFSDYVICPESTRFVKRLGLPINEQGDEATQVLIINQHIANVVIYDKFLADRCIVDGYVYTKVLFESYGKVTLRGLKYAEKAFHYLSNRYDFIFYIEPLDTLDSDGTRTTNIDFHTKIVNAFDDVLNKIDNKKVRRVKKGSVRERVNSIMEWLK